VPLELSLELLVGLEVPVDAVELEDFAAVDFAAVVVAAGVAAVAWLW
jgi:hypothetical protein